MRIFLTGQNGFIGSEIYRQAREAGHQVMGLEKPFRMANPPRKEITSFAPEICIHCAWIATPGLYLESPENVYHREWSLALIRRLAERGTRRFVVAGTSAEYGPSVHPLRETDEPGPTTLYGREKNFLRIQLEEEALRSGFDLIWTRIFYPYGPGEHSDRLISFLIRNALSETESPLKQPGAFRDYVHVQDIARAFLLLAEKADPGIFNIGTGEGVGLSALRSHVESTFGSGQLTARYEDSLGVADSVVADITRISEFGWHPQFDMKEGLTTYLHPPKKSQP